jgi:hypothetical protein
MYHKRIRCQVFKERGQSSSNCLIIHLIARDLRISLDELMIDILYSKPKVINRVLGENQALIGPKNDTMDIRGGVERHNEEPAGHLLLQDTGNPE